MSFFCFAHLRWCHNGWASNILVQYFVCVLIHQAIRGVHTRSQCPPGLKYWMLIHYDTIEDGQNIKSHLLFSFLVRTVLFLYFTGGISLSKIFVHHFIDFNWIMASDDIWHIFFKIHILVVWKHGQKRLFTCYVVCLPHWLVLQNETFNCLKYGYLNSWNSTWSIQFFSYLWNGKWYQNDFCVKVILDSCRMHLQQNTIWSPDDISLIYLCWVTYFSHYNPKMLVPNLLYFGRYSGKCTGYLYINFDFLMYLHDSLIPRDSNIQRHLSQIDRFSLVSTKTPKVKWFLRHPEGAMTLTKPENITDLYRQSNRTNWKISVTRITQKPSEPGLKLKIQLLDKFCHPRCDIKFADPHLKFESLCFKPTTQRNLKHKAPSVRALLIHT